MSRAGLGRTRAGCRALRAERVSRASMLALRIRTSRSERPGEERRRCWNSSWLVAGRESTRTLRTPSCSMKRRDSSRAPEPMASMPMTLPTPKTMPRAVRRVRVFWARRLATAWPRSEKRIRESWQAEAPAPLWREGSWSWQAEAPAPPWRRGSLGEGLHGAAGLCGTGFELLVGVGHGDDFAFPDAGDDGLALTAADERDIVGDETAGSASIDEGTAVALEEGLGGNPEDIIEGFDGDDEVGGHAGAKFGGGLKEGDAGLKAAVPWGAGGAADVLDLAGEFPAGEGDDPDGDFLTDAEVAAVELADVGADFTTVEIGDLGDSHAGAGGIAELEGGQLHAPIHHVLVGILLHVDVAAGLGLEGHVLDILAGEVGHNACLVLQGLLDGDPGRGSRLLVSKVLGGLAEAVAGGFQEDFVLAGGDGGEGGVAADFELGELDIGPGAGHGVLGFLVGGEGIGFGFDDLLLSLGNIGFGLLELELLLGGIELDHDIAGGDQLARVAEGGDGHVEIGRASGRGRV